VTNSATEWRFELVVRKGVGEEMALVVEEERWRS
jgi:hypothetical protein